MELACQLYGLVDVKLALNARIVFAPVLFTFSVGLSDVLAYVNFTLTIAPVNSSKFASAATFAAVAAAVGQVPNLEVALFATEVSVVPSVSEKRTRLVMWGSWLQNARFILKIFAKIVPVIADFGESVSKKAYSQRLPP